MSVIVDGISFENLLKARDRFESFRKNLDTDQAKAGAIQSFEYTFELAWKTMRKIVDTRGGHPFTIQGSRDIFRAAAYLHIIDDPKKWFDFIDARNITSHTYNEESADEVIAIFDAFSEELTTFLKKMGVL